MRRGRKSISQTPAPKKERIKGSKTNPKGSAASKSSASSIKLSDSIISTLEKKAEEYNKKHPNKKVRVSTLKAVFRRGAGAYSSSHRPTISGGAPNSRSAWAFARVNKFLLKKGGTKVKAAYVQDDDLMANGGEIKLLAPNGKPSNLTSEQYKLVRTPQFKAWFGDWENDPQNASKVVDENGEPKVVYHATKVDNFNVFDIQKSRYGFFFTSSYELSKTYSEKKELIRGFFLDIKKPNKIDFKGANHEGLIQDKKFRIKNVTGYDTKTFASISNKTLGFDGAIMKNVMDVGEGGWNEKLKPSDIFVVFESNQIKLADGSNTTFDANNSDIRFEDGGEMGEEITCHNCGWHWNTDDSKKFDKYVCHKCGFDNKIYYMHKRGGNLPVGKLARGMSVSEVAAIHGLEAKDIKKELILGVETEMEHTDKSEYARAIALDHLYEDPRYYTKLKKMEGLDKHYEYISKKYANGGTTQEVFHFNTPTGEKSSLSYLQQVLVRTKAFKNWFGDWEMAARLFLQDGKENFEKHYKDVSKVLDYNTLEPRVVYHGTRVENEFFVFDATREAGQGRPYGYFAHNIEYSQRFTTSSQRGHSGAKPYLYQCFANVRNPFMAVGQQYEGKSKDGIGWLFPIIATIMWDKYGEIKATPQTEGLILAVKSQIGKYFEDTWRGGNEPFWVAMARDINKDFKFFLLSYGYDGIFYGEQYTDPYDIDDPSQYTRAVCIFDSNQVKLADGRNIDFDPMNVDIRFKEGGKLMEQENESPNHENMNKREHLRSILIGEKYAEGGKVVGKQLSNTNDGKKGGYFKGRSHAEGGIKAYNVDTGQHIEVEGEEVIITKGAVNDTEKREFEGEMLTNREILSRINQSGGGVAFEDGGEIKGHECGCSGKKYKYGGELMEDFNIMRKMNEPFNLAQKNLQQARSFVDDLISKMK